MSGSVGANTTPSNTSSTTPTFFTGIAVASSFLDAISNTINAATAAMTTAANATLAQANTTAASATATSVSDAAALATAAQAGTAAIASALQSALQQIAMTSANGAGAVQAFLASLPTSPTGLNTGQFWNNGGVPTQVQ